MNAIATIYHGKHGEELAKFRWRHERYAEKCNVEFKPCYGKTSLHRMYDLLDNYDRVLWIDADVLIHDSSPDLFQIVPVDHVGAVDACATGNESEVEYRQNHIITTCNEEGLLVPETGGRYFNLGVAIASNIHKQFWEPRRTWSDHDWREETAINVRMFIAQAKIMSLPECFNRFVYYGQKPKRFTDMSYFLHYAGPPSLEQRIKDMEQQSKQWGDL